jgi:hypothetical protein
MQWWGAPWVDGLLLLFSLSSGNAWGFYSGGASELSLWWKGRF